MLVLEPLEVVVPPVVVVGRVVLVVVDGARVVVVGRTVEVVGVVAGRRPAVAAVEAGVRRAVEVEETPAKRLRGRLVVEGATACGGDRPGEASEARGVAVRNPSRLPPPAPSAIATASVAHRRSSPNRTCRPRVRPSSMIGASGILAGPLATGGPG
jgi:hypothetical protein